MSGNQYTFARLCRTLDQCRAIQSYLAIEAELLLHNSEVVEVEVVVEEHIPGQQKLKHVHPAARNTSSTRNDSMLKYVKAFVCFFAANHVFSPLPSNIEEQIRRIQTATEPEGGERKRTRNNETIPILQSVVSSITWWLQESIFTLGNVQFSKTELSLRMLTPGWLYDTAPVPYYSYAEIYSNSSLLFCFYLFLCRQSR